MSLATAAGAELVLRPAGIDDAAFVADVLTAARPDDPEDPVVTRYRWEHPNDDVAWERSVVAVNGRDAGMCAYGRSPWGRSRGRYARLQAELVPSARTAARLEALVAILERRAADDGADHASVWAWEDDALKRAAIAGRGFAEQRRARFWELDLVVHASGIDRMTAAARERMRSDGVHLLTLAEDDDPDRYRQLWRTSEEAQQDVPTTMPHAPHPFEGFMRWLRDPAHREDRIWVARLEDTIVGISVLAYPPVRGVIYTEWTGVARSARGRGIARALKCETLTQAIALGVPSVRTDNDAENAPILHLNGSMGYRPHGEMIQHIKQL